MCKANHAAERRYAQCEITENRSALGGVRPRSHPPPSAYSSADWDQLGAPVINSVPPQPPILELDQLCVRAKGRLVFTCVVYLKTLSCKK